MESWTQFLPLNGRLESLELDDITATTFFLSNRRH